VAVKLPPSDEVRVEMLLREQPDKFTREQAERFVANTPHTLLPPESHGT
jgi:hypothetical protein